MKIRIELLPIALRKVAHEARVTEFAPVVLRQPEANRGAMEQVERGAEHAKTIGTFESFFQGETL